MSPLPQFGTGAGASPYGAKGMTRQPSDTSVRSASVDSVAYQNYYAADVAAALSAASAYAAAVVEAQRAGQPVGAWAGPQLPPPLQQGQPLGGAGLAGAFTGGYAGGYAGGHSPQPPSHPWVAQEPVRRNGSGGSSQSGQSAVQSERSRSPRSSQHSRSPRSSLHQQPAPRSGSNSRGHTPSPPQSTTALSELASAPAAGPQAPQPASAAGAPLVKKLEAPKSRRMAVLVVDDEQVNTKLIQRMLQRSNRVDVTVAFDGSEMVDLIVNQQRSYDCVGARAGRAAGRPGAPPRLSLGVFWNPIRAPVSLFFAPARQCVSDLVPGALCPAQ